MNWKKLLLNAGLAAGWATASFLAEDPKFIAYAAALRFVAGWLFGKLGKPVPVDR